MIKHPATRTGRWPGDSPGGLVEKARRALHLEKERIVSKALLELRVKDTLGVRVARCLGGCKYFLFDKLILEFHITAGISGETYKYQLNYRKFY